ncbi:hypothetical protein HJD18_00875 [Thermoleophilia bacterium SCSIO 60948]|nr:hypothetical protein HJD18_00875 [Thermoleophilia bacterium SCSIO 60948]
MHQPFKSIVVAMIIALSVVAGACGGDDEETTSSTPTTTGATGPTGSTGATGSDEPTSGATAGGALGGAVDNLEAADYEVEEMPKGDLTETIGLDKPITAVAGVYATEPGGPAQLAVEEYGSPQEAEDVAKAIDMNFTEAEIADGTIVVSLTDDTREEIDAAVAVIEGK